jgi:vacuolar-type H+-ATPase subunit C/Vma6
MRWDDVNARARGLATHLLPRTELGRLAESRAWEEFVNRLAQAGYPVLTAGRLPSGADEFARRTGDVAADRFAVLARWLGPRRATLAVLYEDEERRTLRVLLRGAVEGASAGARLRAAVPTPDLPPRVLDRLAHADSPADLARRLVSLGHPAGRVLQTELDSGRELGLLGLEAALGRLFATRTTRAVRKAGPLVRAFAQLLLDLENAWSLLLRGNWGSEPDADAVFLPGGRWLSRERFDRLAAGDQEAVAQGLQSAFASSPVAGAFNGEGVDPVRIEGGAVRATIAWLRTLARRDPLSPAVLLHVLLRIQAERRDLRAVAAGLSLGAPPRVILTHLVSA